MERASSTVKSDQKTPTFIPLCHWFPLASFKSRCISSSSARLRGFGATANLPSVAIRAVGKRRAARRRISVGGAAIDTAVRGAQWKVVACARRASMIWVRRSAGSFLKSSSSRYSGSAASFSFSSPIAMVLPWPQTPPIPAGDTHSYDYAPIAGTYWMHSHRGMQEQSLMTAPLIVRSAEDLRADRQEVVLMLHDFSFQTPDALLAALTKSNGSQSAMPKSGMGNNMNMDSGSMGAMNSGTMGAMNMGPGMEMDLNDIDYDAFLANDRTFADPEVIRTEPGGRVRPRLINAASATQFWIDLGALSGTVVSVDGHAVRPVRGSRLPLAMAQRLDVLIDVPRNGSYPISAQVEGKRARTGIVLAASGASVSRLAAEAGENAPPVDLSLERRLEAVTPLAPRAPDLTHRVILAGAMAPYAWSLNGEYWPNVTPLMIAPGQRVAIEMLNHTMMPHPMHLHGHAFQVVAINGAPLAGAVRDTVLVPPMGSVTIAFDADNPGRWAFHCHNLYHMMTGMMTEVRYPAII
jgi:FtsP/CotA-like multicopper oxidase with cupredoxin domain